jgi:hypothetical protein
MLTSSTITNLLLANGQRMLLTGAMRQEGRGVLGSEMGCLRDGASDWFTCDDCFASDHPEPRNFRPILDDIGNRRGRGAVT